MSLTLSERFQLAEQARNRKQEGKIQQVTLIANNYSDKPPKNVKRVFDREELSSAYSRSMHSMNDRISDRNMKSKPQNDRAQNGKVDQNRSRSIVESKPAKKSIESRLGPGSVDTRLGPVLKTIEERLSKAPVKTHTVVIKKRQENNGPIRTSHNENRKVKSSPYAKRRQGKIDPETAMANLNNDLDSYMKDAPEIL